MNESLMPPTEGQEFEAHLERREVPVVSFDQYRQLCDQETNDFRKIGIQDPEAYALAVEDPLSVFAKYYGQRMPLLTPLNYEKMYESERCDEMLEGRELLLLSLPVNILGSPEFELEDEILVPERGVAVIVEQFADPSIDDTDDFVSSLSFGGDVNVRIHEFVNPLLESNPGHETSWMASYRFTIVPKHTEAKAYTPHESISDEVMDNWRALCQEKDIETMPGDNPQGTFLLSAEQLADRVDIIDSLWEISEVGFGKVLGAHHPVSMEFNREFFDSQIVSRDTLTAIYYDEGKPVCFGFVGLGMHSNEWLNCDSEVLKNELAQAREDDQLYVHFYELISSGAKGMGYSTNIVTAFYELAERTGYETSVFFESTNLSATYIPAILENEAVKSDSVAVKQPVKMLGKLNYRAVLADPGHSQHSVDSLRA